MKLPVTCVRVNFTSESFGFFSKVDNNIVSVGEQLLHLNKINANFIRHVETNYVETGDSHPHYLAVRGHYLLLAASCQ